MKWNPNASVPLLTLAALVFGLACGGGARHREACKAYVALPAPSPAVAMIADMDVLGGAPAAPRNSLPSIGSGSEQPRHEPICSDGALEVMAYASNMRLSALRVPPVGIQSMLSTRSARCRALAASPRRNAAPTTHVVLLL